MQPVRAAGRHWTVGIELPQCMAHAVDATTAGACSFCRYNYWPQSEACPECRGLPEEMSHTLQALRRGYAGDSASQASN